MRACLRQVRVSRNIKRWRDAAMEEAGKGFRRLKAYKQLPGLRKSLTVLHELNGIDTSLASDAAAA